MDQDAPVETPTPTNYGPEYTRVEKLRNDIGELKKVMVNLHEIGSLNITRATLMRQLKQL
jgi:hypothetical protein